MAQLYILDDNLEPRPVDDAARWQAWMETTNRSVRRDTVGLGADARLVSTVFLGIDYAQELDPAPLLYETQVFVYAPHGWTEDPDYPYRRYATRAQALIGHDELLAHVEARLDQAEELRWLLDDVEGL